MKNPTEAEKLKDVEVDINRMKNRIEKLKKKSLFEKSSIEKNKSMADQILYQKMLLAEEIAERNRNNVNWHVCSQQESVKKNNILSI